MKTINTALLSVLAIASNLSVAASDKFSCERIKEKVVREACVKDRVSKDVAERPEKARIAEEKAQAEAARELEAQAIADRKRAADEFVSKSKQLLVRSLKDPDSAKYSNLVIAQSDGKKILCGTINAKNSYGGYVGAKAFYVQWDEGTSKAPEVYIDGDIMARASARIDELAAIAGDSSAGLGSQMQAATQGDRVLAQAKKTWHVPI